MVSVLDIKWNQSSVGICSSVKFNYFLLNIALSYNIDNVLKIFKGIGLRWIFGQKHIFVRLLKL